MEFDTYIDIPINNSTDQIPTTSSNLSSNHVSPLKHPRTYFTPTIDKDERIAKGLGNPSIDYPIRYIANTNAERKTYKCWYCPTVSYDMQGHERHLNGHIQQSTFECQQCSFSAERSQVLTLHEVCHTPAYFERRSSLASKKKRHHGIIFAIPKKAKKAKARKRFHFQSSSAQMETPFHTSFAAEGDFSGAPRPKQKKSTHQHQYSTTTSSTPLPSGSFTPDDGTFFPHKCPYPRCPNAYKGLADYRIHVKGHEIRRKFTCEICTFSSDWKQIIQRHMKRHGATKGFQRQKLQANKKGLGFGSGASKTDKKYVPTAPATPTSTSAPTKTPSSVGKNFKCPIENCPEAFPSSRDLRIHLERHLQPISNGHQCELCSYTGLTRHLLERHVEKHAKEAVGTPAIPIPIKQERDENGYLIKHKQVKHAQIKKPNTLGVNLKRKYVYWARPSMRSWAPNRIYRPTGQKGTLYRCEVAACPHEFYKKFESEKHLALHRGNFKYKCEKCSYTCKKEFLLKNHISKHVEKELAATQSSSISYGSIAATTATDAMIPNLQANYGVPVNAWAAWRPTQPQQRTVYRPGWMKINMSKATKKKFQQVGFQGRGGMQFTKRYRRNLIKDGVISAAELHIIRQGNPAFQNQYPDSVTYSTGTVVKASFRCFHCPLGFASLILYQRHQRVAHRDTLATTAGMANSSTSRTVSRPNMAAAPGPIIKTCQICGFRSDQKDVFSAHCQTHIKSCRVLVSECDLSTRRNAGLIDGYTIDVRRVEGDDDGGEHEHEQGAMDISNSTSGGWVSADEVLNDLEERRNNYETKSDSTASTELVAKEQKQESSQASSKPVNGVMNLMRSNTSSTGSIGDNNNDDLFGTPPESPPEDMFDQTDYLITKVVMTNFMKFEHYIFQPNNSGDNLSVLQGGSHCGKTSVLLACLIGLGYDFLIGLNDRDSLCGVQLSSILQHGKNHGSIEITLNLGKFIALSEIYGNQLTVKRSFFEGVRLEESEFELSYNGATGERITSDGIKWIMTEIIPPFLHRLVVLNPENVEFFVENFQACNEVFWQVVDENELRNSHISEDIVLIRDDLASRRLRIEYLETKLATPPPPGIIDDKLIGKLRELQARELEKAQEQFESFDETLKKLVEEHELTVAAAANNLPDQDPLSRLLAKMRQPFQDFIHTQNYIGDIVIDRTTRDMAIWIKDNSYISETMTGRNKSLAEAKFIWKTLTMRRRQLAITGLYFAFWHVLSVDISPIILADTFSSSEFEFHLADSAFPILAYIVEQESSRQFLISAPGQTADGFVERYGNY